MISATGVMLRRDAMVHRQGLMLVARSRLGVLPRWM
jgi:hypothetical protein